MTVKAPVDRANPARARTEPRAAAIAALLFCVWSSGVEAQAAPAPAPAEQQPADAAPIDKFDLAAALMADSGGMTSNDAAKRARARAPQIVSARATAHSAQIDVDGAWTAFVPTVDLGVQYKHVNLVKNNVGGAAPDMEAPPPNVPPEIADAVNAALGTYFSKFNFTQPQDQISLTAGAQWVLSDVFLRSWPTYKANVGLAAAQKTQVEVTEATVELTARNAFYDYARALAQRAVDEQSLKQADAQAAQIKLFVDAGTVAQVDHMTARARVEEARSALAASSARVRIAQNTLATLLGMKAEEIKGIAEPVLDPPDVPSGVTIEDLTRSAFDRRAELRVLRKLVEANEKVVVAQRGGAFPQVIVSAADMSARPNPRVFPPNTTGLRNTWEVGAALSWRLNNTATGTYATRKAEAQLAKTRADLNAQEDAIRIEIVNAYQTYDASRAVNVASQARLEAAEEAYRVRLATYTVGAGVIVDLLNADLAVSLARLALANSAITTRSALAAVKRAAGLDMNTP